MTTKQIKDYLYHYKTSYKIVLSHFNAIARIMMMIFIILHNLKKKFQKLVN